MRRREYDIQGRIVGIPYDFRLPTWSKVANRLYAPGGAMVVPKVFGCGWTLNMGHRGSQLILAATVVASVVAIVSG
jgi:Family of unknown function (DUF5808)